MFEVEKGVPVPKKKTGSNFKGAMRVHPFRLMEPGDSFFAPGYKAGAGSRGNGKQITVAYGKKCFPGSKWAMRAVEESGVLGVRVWRLT